VLLQYELLVDRLVCRVAQENIREKLLQSDDLTLQKAIKLCHVIELSDQYIIIISKGTDSTLAEVKAVHKVKVRHQRLPATTKRRRNSDKPSQLTNTVTSSSRRITCEYSHVVGIQNSPERDRECHACKLKGHFAKSSKCMQRRFAKIDEQDDYEDARLRWNCYTGGHMPGWTV